MAIDPATAALAAAAISKTSSWLWENYGKRVVERLGREGYGRARWSMVSLSGF